MTYACPTCDSNNPNRYLQCNHPMCPDGHDQRRLDVPMRRAWQPAVEQPKRGVSHGMMCLIVLWAVLMTAFLVMAWTKPAHALISGN